MPPSQVQVDQASTWLRCRQRTQRLLSRRDRDTYLHEFGHACGLHHAHQHPDREVIILREVLLAADQYAEFQELRLQLRSDHKILTENVGYSRYDRLSIMHYSRGDNGELCFPQYRHPRNDERLRWCDIFEQADEGCVVPLSSHCSNEDIQLGGDTLSQGDIETPQTMYGGPQQPVDGIETGEL